MKFVFIATGFLFSLSCGNKQMIVESPIEDSISKIKREITHQIFKAPTLDSIKSYWANATELDCKGIPDSIWEIKTITSIHIQGEDCDYGPIIKNGKEVCCGIHEISPKIGQLTNLEEIALPINPISEFPKEITQCQKLKKIDLTDCTVSNIDHLTGLSNLEELMLFGCHLEKLPNDIGKLKKLRYLGLTGNWQLTDDEIKRVKKALPKCEIIFER